MIAQDGSDAKRNQSMRNEQGFLTPFVPTLVAGETRVRILFMKVKCATSIRVEMENKQETEVTRP